MQFNMPEFPKDYDFFIHELKFAQLSSVFVLGVVVYITSLFGMNLFKD